MTKGWWVELGRMAYGPCWELQKELAAKVASGDHPDTVLFVEHDPVLTLGASFDPSHLLLSKSEYTEMGIELHPTDRGGDVTYHGPGQLVIYPILDVSRHGKDLHKWMRDLEETMLATLAHFGIKGRRFPPHTGAWVGDQKIAAIGVKIRRWVNMHGIALNCANPLVAFEAIVPCGIHDYGVTSISQELGEAVTREQTLPVVISAYESVFDMKLAELTKSDLTRTLEMNANVTAEFA